MSWVSSLVFCMFFLIFLSFCEIWLFYCLLRVYLLRYFGFFFSFLISASLLAWRLAFVFDIQGLPPHF